MLNRNNLAVLSALIGITATVCLIYIGQDQYAGYALIAGFVSMVFTTTVGKESGSGLDCDVVGNMVDGVDLSFMGQPTSYTSDVKRCREHFCNLPGQASKMPWARAHYLVQNWRKSKGMDTTIKKPPSKIKQIWNKFLLSPVALPSRAKTDGDQTVKE